MKRAATVTEMRRSWLVQRLDKPRGSFMGMKDSPFAFGGGLRNGGLSGEAMDLLRGIWSFDYMGAAEFEFGAVPEALSRLAGLADKKRLTTAVLDIDLSKVARHWDWPKDAPDPVGTKPVYILAAGDHMPEVKKRITAWSKKAYGDHKESLRLTGTLLPTSEYHGETVGWLELDNGFMFFTDEAMFAATCDLFGVKR